MTTKSDCCATADWFLRRFALGIVFVVIVLLTAYVPYSMGRQILDSQRAMRQDMLEIRIAEAITASPNAAAIVTNEACDIESWSPGAAAVFGYSPAEVKGQSIEILMAPKSQARHHLGMCKHQHDGGVKVPVVIDRCWGKKKDGKTFPIHVNIRPCHCGGTSYYFVMIDSLERLALLPGDAEASHK